MKKYLLLSLVAALSLPSFAQEENDANQWYIGMGGGVHFSKLLYSNLNKDHFPQNNSKLSGVYSIFGEFDFGRHNMFAIRPQFSFLTRGGRLSQIGNNYYEGYNPALDPEDRLTDVVYGLKAQCFDFRVPFMYQIGKQNWKVRPYIFVAPILSVVNHGYVSATNYYADGSFEGYKYDLSNANMTSVMFSGAFGIGAKWQFDVNGHNFFLGVDVSYEHTFTDTYGKGEKEGDVGGISFYPGSNAVEGTRRMHGLEINASFGIPLSVFSRRKPAPVTIEEPVYVEPAPVQEIVEIIEPNCYSLDEIMNMMKEGRDVKGKKICAIDDINFEFAKSTIKSSSHAYLDKLARLLNSTDAKVVICGHTDNIGSEATNLELSKQRAQAVLSYLVKKGVDRQRLSYRYYGMSKPIATNDTEEGRQMNRRVEFEIQ